MYLKCNNRNEKLIDLKRPSFLPKNRARSCQLAKLVCLSKTKQKLPTAQSV